MKKQTNTKPQKNQPKKPHKKTKKPPTKPKKTQKQNQKNHKKIGKKSHRTWTWCRIFQDLWYLSEKKCLSNFS